MQIGIRQNPTFHFRLCPSQRTCLRFQVAIFGDVPYWIHYNNLYRHLSVDTTPDTSMVQLAHTIS